LVDKWAQRDPIVMFEKFLVGVGIGPNLLQAVVTRVEEELATELASAEASPMPAGDSGTTDVYFGSPALDPTPEIVRKSKKARGL